jgi:hypothetical protein
MTPSKHPAPPAAGWYERILQALAELTAKPPLH